MKFMKMELMELCFLMSNIQGIRKNCLQLNFLNRQKIAWFFYGAICIIPSNTFLLGI